MLGRLGLELSGSLEIWDIGQMDTDCPFPKFPPQLTDGFHERGTLDVTDGSSHLDDDEIVVDRIVIPSHSALDFVSDVRHDLYRLSQIISLPLLVDHRLVDPAGSDGVALCGPDAGKPFVVSEIQVGFHAVYGDIALAMLIRVQSTRIDVDVGIELLDGDAVPVRLKQVADA